MKKIEEEKFYTPTEISSMNNVLTASNPSTRRQMLLRHIRDNKIQAINVGGKKKARYIIQGKNLIDYLKSNIPPEAYIKK